MQAVVLAGGRGTRLHGAEGPPKVLTPLCGAPVLDHILGWLAPQGVRDAVLCTGHKAEEVERAVGDGSRFGMRVRYSREKSPLGTAGAVKAAEPMLAERFVVAYGDVIADVDLRALLAAHLASGALATLVVHPNDHPLDSDRVVTDARGHVLRFVRKDERAGPEAGALCNAALYVIERRLLERVPADGRARDFARDVFPMLVAAGEKIYAYRTAEYLKDMGTPERAAKVEQDLARGVPVAMRRAALRPALLVDRDGVLVEQVPHLKRVEDLRLIPGAAEALARVNRAGILAVCCTNQPVVARGELSEEGLHEIHRHMEGLLGAGAAWLDGIFYCPHHPDRGFAGERSDLKVACTCRKPMPGLIFQAEAALGIDRRASVFVGDHSTDLAAARAAGVLGIGVLTGYGCADGLEPLRPETPLVRDLAQAVALMLGTAPSWDPWIEEVRRARVVLLGGPSRAGKTVAAAALHLRLQSMGVPVLHLSMDRWILPHSVRVPGSRVAERTRYAEASQALARLVAGEAVLVPGYDPRTREAAPAEMVQWSGRGVLVVDGLLAAAVDLPGAMRVALCAEPSVLRARREAFYVWKGLDGAELRNAVDGRSEEHAAVLAAQARASLRLSLGEDLVLSEVT